MIPFCHFNNTIVSLHLSIFSRMSAIAGALGSIIGYLGSEVAEPSVFERLLWPQRFHNDFGFFLCLQMIIFLPMGGPLHAAALKTLDKFRDNALYWGRKKGHCLGTAFYQDTKLRYYHISGPRPSEGKEVRNGFWPQVLLRIKPSIPLLPPSDTEKNDDPPIKLRRAAQVVYHLRLRNGSGVPSAASDAVAVAEDTATWRTYFGILFSETSAVCLAIFVGVYEKNVWLPVYLCLPLLFKGLALVFSVARDQLEPPEKQICLRTELFQINLDDQDYMIIEGPDSAEQKESTTRQFFRHYGHPKRSRWREVGSMTVVYAFVLHFPAGLISLLWMPEEIQYIWLGYQVYLIVAMHIIRLSGQVGMGRTERRVARALRDKKEVWLSDRSKEIVIASLKWSCHGSVDDAKKAVVKIQKDHQERQSSIIDT
ncbi:hypothetical protein BGZ57DRAFT_887414 [Hyaloscypha finlandica]|nr:hypothetical protein BGZ57DRAFT_887414 [Hyaloscypha finlandica]